MVDAIDRVASTRNGEAGKGRSRDMVRAVRILWNVVQTRIAQKTKNQQEPWFRNMAKGMSGYIPVVMRTFAVPDRGKFDHGLILSLT